MFEDIYFIGLANGLKPLYILQSFMKNSIVKEKQIHLITDKREGVVVEFCHQSKIPVLMMDDQLLIDKLESSKKILIAIGWNKLIHTDFLELFDAAINCHGGLLPEYRGNNVYMHSYANIADEYGPTIHYMNEKFDDGNIIVQARAKMFLEETPLIIHRRMSEMTAWILPEAIRLVENGYLGEKQKGIAKYFYKMGRIEMENLRQENIENLRAGRPLKIAKCKEWKL